MDEQKLQEPVVIPEGDPMTEEPKAPPTQAEMAKARGERKSYLEGLKEVNKGLEIEVKYLELMITKMKYQAMLSEILNPKTTEDASQDKSGIILPAGNKDIKVVSSL